MVIFKSEQTRKFCVFCFISQTDDGNIYYFHFITGESIWDHPCDDYYRKMYEAEKAKKVSEFFCNF